MDLGFTYLEDIMAELADGNDLSASEALAKAKAKVYELAHVGPYGPSNREERRRVEKVLRILRKRGLLVNLE